MVFRRNPNELPRELTDEEQDDDFNIISADDDDDDDDGDVAPLFEEGARCDVCHSQTGRVGLDPSGRGAYDGDPVLSCFRCLPETLKSAWSQVEGAAIVVEPFEMYAHLYYYRVDEMPAYQFVREDIEAISWLLLTIGDDCSRCGQQSHVAWLTDKFVDPDLPENERVFRGLDRDLEHLCQNCTATALAQACEALDLPLMTLELPRSAMGVLMPAGN